MAALMIRHPERLRMVAAAGALTFAVILFAAGMLGLASKPSSLAR
jgi:hypothetical protein